MDIHKNNVEFIEKKFLRNCDKNVNKDLAKERQKCSINLKEITLIFDGGEKMYDLRKHIERITLDSGLSKDKVPEECLSPKERYENSVRKSCLLANIVRTHVMSLEEIEMLGTPILRHAMDAFFKEVSPFLLHLGMFVPTLLGQGTPEQRARWLPLALQLKIIGTYAQTELGHGTFIRGLETTATYDPQTEEFILHSPTLTSYKWWAGGMGNTVNHCIVLAQLYTKGQCYGVHPFVVQIRDLETHMPLPGITVGDIGPRMGFNTADNGFLGFDNFRISRDNMLMKNAQVLKDGTYVKVARHEKLTYGTMVFVRVTLVNEAAYHLAKAATIAVRYSAVRRQCRVASNEPEPQILDYLTQQHKLFICISTAFALQLTSSWLWTTFTTVLAEMRDGNIDGLPELHALSSCLKALSTSESAALIERCRLACGGHGYMLSSNLPLLYSFVTATRTYEGDYTVLLLQTARFLVKTYEQVETGKPLTPTVSYMQSVNNHEDNWNLSNEGIIKAFQKVAARKTAHCVNVIRTRQKNGMSYEDAWQATTVQLVAAAEAHCRAVLSNTYNNEIVRLTANFSQAVKNVMTQLVQLYLMYWALETTGDLLRYTSISEKDMIDLQNEYEDLLQQIRPNAVGLVDAFDIRDEILQSTLGAYDGRVYERLMAEALKSPLNQEPVNQSFHKYLKPLMKGKL